MSEPDPVVQPPTTAKTEIGMLFMRANGIKKKEDDSNKAADSFYQIENEAGEVVGRSIIVHNDLNPAWPPLKLDLEKMCNKQRTQKVSIVFYDYDEKKPNSPKELGRVVTNLSELHKASMEIKAQRGVVFFDRKASFQINNDCNDNPYCDTINNKPFKVYIYDVVEILGTPTPEYTSEIELLRGTISNKIELLDESESKIMKLREQIRAFEEALSQKEAYIIQELKRREEEDIEQKTSGSAAPAPTVETAKEDDDEDTEDLLAAAQAEIEHLKSSIGETTELLSQAENQNVILQLQIDAYKVESHDLRVLVDEIRQERDAQREALETAASSEKALQESLSLVKSEMEELKSAVETKEQLLSESEAKHTKYQEEVISYEEKLMHHKSLVVTLLQEKADTEAKLAESKICISEKLDSATAQVNQLQATLEDKDGLLEDSKAENSEFEKQIARFEEELKEQKKALKGTTESRKTLEEDLTKAQMEITELQELVETKNSVIDESGFVVAEYKEKVTQIQSKLQDYEKQIDSLSEKKTMEESQVEESKSSIQENLEATKIEMDKLRVTLSKNVRLLSESESKNASLTEQVSSMQEKLNIQESAKVKLDESKKYIQDQFNALQIHMEELKSAVAEKESLLSDSEARNVNLNDKIATFEACISEKEDLILKLNDEKITTEEKLINATKIIQDKLEQTSHHMNRLRCKVAEKDDLLKKVESEKCRLEEKFEETTNAQGAMVKKLQAEYDAQAERLNNMVKAKTLLQGKYDAATSEIQILKYAATENIEKLNESEYWIMQFKEQITGFEVKVKEQDALIERLRTEKANTDEQFKNMLWMKIQIDKLLSDAKLDIERLNADLEQKNNRISEVEAENAELKKKNAELVDDNAGHQALFEQQFNESLTREADFKAVVKCKEATEKSLTSATSEVELLKSTVAQKDKLLNESKCAVAQYEEMVAALEGKCQDQETLVAKLQSEKAMLEKKKGEDEKTKQEVEEKDALINEAKKENSKLSEEMSKLKEEVLARQLLVMQWEKESKSREAALKEVTEAKKSIEERLETIFKYPQLAYVFNDEEELNASLNASSQKTLIV